jgi:hypothetical protein
MLSIAHGARNYLKYAGNPPAVRLSILNMRALCFLTLAALAVPPYAHAAAPGHPCVEDFADVAALTAQGWSIRNRSDPVGGRAWRQGDTSVFTSWDGAPDAYAAADGNSLKEWPGVISVWLVTPVIDFGPNSISARAFDFQARAVPGVANRLVVRQCLTSEDEACDVPVEGIGGFTTTLIEINPDLNVAGFPEVWTYYIATPGDGLATVGTGRIAFHYSIPIQPDGSHGSYIGVDSAEMIGATTCPFGEIVFENGFD